MSVAIRLTRRGTRNRPHYRLVASDRRARRDGRFIEMLGWYDPHPNPVHVYVDLEKVDKWLAVGAKPSKTATRLIEKVRRDGPNIPASYNLPGQVPKAAEAAATTPETEAAEAAEAPVAEAAPEPQAAKAESGPAEPEAPEAESSAPEPEAPEAESSAPEPEAPAEAEGKDEA
jgi:small subunit ribosomal protein S16